MTAWTSQPGDTASRHDLASPASQRAGPAITARQRFRRWPTRRTRRVLAALLALSGLIAAGRTHSARSPAARVDPYLQRMTLHPSRQPDGTLTIAAPLPRGSYSVDVIFPGDAPPLDFGLAYHEVRRHVAITVRAAHQASPLLTVPNSQTHGVFEDQLDSRSGVELCNFHADSPDTLTIACHIDQGPPWPEQVSIGISRSDAGAPATIHPNEPAKAALPFSFVFPALLVCAGVALCWK